MAIGDITETIIYLANSLRIR